MVWGGYFWHSSYYLREGIVSAYSLDLIAFFRNFQVLHWSRHLISALWDSMSAVRNTPPKIWRIRSHGLGSVCVLFAWFSRCCAKKNCVSIHTKLYRPDFLAEIRVKSQNVIVFIFQNWKRHRKSLKFIVILKKIPQGGLVWVALLNGR